MKQGWFYSLGLALSLAGAPTAGTRTKLGGKCQYGLEKINL